MIFLCRPRAVERIWGSLRSPAGAAVGETWWLCDGPAHHTVLVDPASGREAGTAASAAEAGLLPGGRCHVMIKTLHTAARLSVQVHPGAFGGALCKAETWIFLRVEEGSRVLAGLEDGVTLESLESSLSAGNLDAILKSWEVRAGDSLHLPPGTVHALGAGFEVLEVQQNCDVTYRLSDWGRLGADGCPRRLDVEEGLRSVDARGGRPIFVENGVPEGLGHLAGYEIAKLEGCEVALPGGGAFFSVGGGVVTGGRHFEPPCCLVASSGGGSFRAEGPGYAVTCREER